MKQAAVCQNYAVVITSHHPRLLLRSAKVVTNLYTKSLLHVKTSTRKYFMENSNIFTTIKVTYTLFKKVSWNVFLYLKKLNCCVGVCAHTCDVSQSKSGGQRTMWWRLFSQFTLMWAPGTELRSWDLLSEHLYPLTHLTSLFHSDPQGLI